MSPGRKKRLIGFYLALVAVALVLNVLQAGGLLAGVMLMGAAVGLAHLGLIVFFNGIPEIMAGFGHGPTPPEPDYVLGDRKRPDAADRTSDERTRGDGP